MQTGLVLSGGGSLGSYQIGVWKALREMNIRPDIITGTSVGALNGALIIQDSYDVAQNLWKSLDTKAVFDFPKEPDLFTYTKTFFSQGGVCRKGLEAIIRNHLQEDKIRVSKVPLGMVLTRKKDLTAYQVFTEDVPNGMLCDYLMATTACFPATQHHTISGVDYIDGGYCDNLPISLAKQKGAEQIIAVCLNEEKAKKLPLCQADHIITIYPRWDLGNWLLFHKEDTDRNIRLGYLDAMKTFGVYEGDAYTFQKHTFQKLSAKKQVAISRFRRLLNQKEYPAINKLFPQNPTSEEILKTAAEITGKLLKLSPYRIYTADTFRNAVRRKQNCPTNLSLSKMLRNNPCPGSVYASRSPKETVASIFLSVFL